MAFHLVCVSIRSPGIQGRASLVIGQSEFPFNDIVLCDFYVHVRSLRTLRAFVGTHL